LAGRLGRQTWPADLAGRLGRQTWPADLASRLGRQTWPADLAAISHSVSTPPRNIEQHSLLYNILWKSRPHIMCGTWLFGVYLLDSQTSGPKCANVFHVVNKRTEKVKTAAGPKISLLLLLFNPADFSQRAKSATTDSQTSSDTIDKKKFDDMKNIAHPLQKKIWFEYFSMKTCSRESIII
jgi:hypothetical protein